MQTQTPLRILHVFAEMNRGGAETMIMNLYRNIDRSKIQFDFIVHTSENCAYDNEIISLGGNIFRIPKYTGTNHFQYKKAWIDFFESNSDYKVIHGHVRSTASIYLKIAKKFGLITISHSHSTSSGSGIIAVIKNILQFPIRYIADYLFACSEDAGKWLYGKNACHKENFFILKNAIDAKKYIFNEEIRNEVRKKFNIENKFIIGHIGRFNTPKNHNFLVDIFKAIHDENENSVLMLIGEGNLKNRIKEKVNKLGLANDVIFTGVRSDIPELLQAMDVFVFPSLYEGLGIVVIEAQAAGLPCVVADTIPKEALITKNVEQISLDSSPEIWRKVIFNQFNSFTRTNNYSDIKKSCYDIEENKTWLEEFYLGLVEKHETRFCN